MHIVELTRPSLYDERDVIDLLGPFPSQEAAEEWATRFRKQCLAPVRVKVLGIDQLLKTPPEPDVEAMRLNSLG